MNQVIKKISSQTSFIPHIHLIYDFHKLTKLPEKSCDIPEHCKVTKYVHFVSFKFTFQATNIMTIQHEGDFQFLKNIVKLFKHRIACFTLVIQLSYYFLRILSPSKYYYPLNRGFCFFHISLLPSDLCS